MSERSGWLGDASAQRSALLTASTTSLVWPSSSMPPLLTAKWKTANRDYWREVPCSHRDKRSLAHTHTNSHFHFYNSYLKGVYKEVIEAEVDILHIISHARSLWSPKCEGLGHQANCYNKLPALHQKPPLTIASISQLLHVKITWSFQHHFHSAKRLNRDDWGSLGVLESRISYSMLHKGWQYGRRTCSRGWYILIFTA